MVQHSNNDCISANILNPLYAHITVNKGSMHECKETTQSITDNRTNAFTKEMLDVNNVTTGTMRERRTIDHQYYLKMSLPYPELLYNPAYMLEQDQMQVYSISAGLRHQVKGFSIKSTLSMLQCKCCCECCGEKRWIICAIAAIIIVVTIIVTTVLAMKLSSYSISGNSLSPAGPTFPTTYSCNTSTSCGCSTKSAILTRIIGGEAAGLQTWGWAVLLSIKDSLCGGSIIADSWILTAAHCVMGATVSQITIYAGSNAQRNGSQILSVATITIHPHYSPSTYVNDIALLYLSTPLNITDRSVSTICLPSVNLSTLSASEWPPPGTRVSSKICLNVH
ncbi:unnamed protein product [Rotaria sp. Silwood1]|nr:unnamed protein product [Rotaria sp. Silwood1]